MMNGRDYVYGETDGWIYFASRDRCVRKHASRAAPTPSVSCLSSGPNRAEKPPAANMVWVGRSPGACLVRNSPDAALARILADEMPRHSFERNLGHGAAGGRVVVRDNAITGPIFDQ
ncbi:hypothetical protein ACLOJK_016445 [Asimina triloba]